MIHNLSYVKKYFCDFHHYLFSITHGYHTSTTQFSLLLLIPEEVEYSSPSPELLL